MKSDPVYPLSAVRALALHAQGLTDPLAPDESIASAPWRASTRVKTRAPTPDDLYTMIVKIGCVQIDTLQMVQRSQYLVLWSRLGNYNPADLDRLAYGNARCNASAPDNTARLFEYWLHAACLIPLADYRWRLPLMRGFQEGGSLWNQEWLARIDSVALTKAVLQRIRDEGPLRASDFESEGPRRGSWWNWKPAKHALEQLYNQGHLMIADRINFQRVYDLRERVLPDWVDTNEPAPAAMKQHLLEQSVRSLGICRPPQIANYFPGIRSREAGVILAQLVDAGVLMEVRADLGEHEPQSMIVHRDNMLNLEQAADGALNARRTTFLSPFDNLFWARNRDREIWNFEQSLEAYRPVEKRKWGYFTLPILHHDKLVGRLDPKLERQSHTLRLRGLFLEPRISPNEQLVHDVAAAMRDFMAFHDATDLIVEHSRPAAFGKKLLAALSLGG